MTRGIHWFRNDLRLRDNTALNALSSRADEALTLFVLDPRIWRARGRPRERFLMDCLSRLARDLEKRGLPLLVRTGQPERVIGRLLKETGASVLSFNEDVSPFAVARDEAVRTVARRSGGEVLSTPDHVVYPASEIRTGKGGPFAVYSPYRKKWWSRWQEDPRLPVRRVRLPSAIPGYDKELLPEPVTGSHDISLPVGGEAAARRRLDSFLETAAERYHEDRDRPDRDGTSRLSPYLRFGALSVRECVTKGLEAANERPAAREGISKWLDELVWRDFYSAVLEENPHVLRKNHRREFDELEWNHDPRGFEAWCEGRTGYPIVDAGMRQLRETGWMHNRVRMIVASFLTKDLLIDWRRGERWFFEHLVDGDPASNSGGWQWAASTGTDAQPYFRIFNPVRQGVRCDPQGAYVRRWIPELRGVDVRFVHEPWRAPVPPADYPAPIVDHAERRAECLERFRRARHA